MPKLRRVLLAGAGIALALPVILLLTAWIVVAHPQLPVVRRAAAALADSSRLRQDVETLTSSFGPRDHDHPENLDRVAAFVRDAFAAAGAQVADQSWQVDGRTYRNAIARFGPDTGPRIVVGAHYDTVHDHPGADDDASGVAALIEMARHLGRMTLSAPVELVAYALEETQLQHPGAGSMVHAASLRDAGVDVRLMIALDEIGYFATAPGSQRYPVPQLTLVYPTRGDFIGVIGRLDQSWSDVGRIKRAIRRTTDLRAVAITVPVRVVPSIDNSDHSSYWLHGYPAVLVNNTAGNRNPNKHGAGDLPSTLDYGRMAKVVTGVLDVVVQLASS